MSFRKGISREKMNVVFFPHRVPRFSLLREVFKKRATTKTNRGGLVEEGTQKKERKKKRSENFVSTATDMSPF